MNTVVQSGDFWQIKEQGAEGIWTGEFRKFEIGFVFKGNRDC